VTSEHERLDALREAAVEAEFETGRREDSVEEARDAIHVRLARMTLGWLLLIAGVAMLALPGPGWITIAAALAILSKDFLWAERTLARIAHRIPKGEDGEIHIGVIVFSGLMLVLALAGSGWWYLLR
jgi:uncharacterized protein (TIGR02611 family)